MVVFYRKQMHVMKSSFFPVAPIQAVDLLFGKRGQYQTMPQRNLLLAAPSRSLCQALASMCPGTGDDPIALAADFSDCSPE